MYAIIRAGGKQYKVEAGDTLRVEKLEKNLGDVFHLPEVLMVSGEKTFVGQPLVKDAIVEVMVTRQAKAPKVIVFKKKRRQGYRRMQGHRQLFTELFVKSITTPEGKKFETEKKAMVIDPVKIQARKDAFAAKAREEKRARKSSAGAALEAEPVKKAAKKAAPAKKAAGKKTAKKVTKKAAGKKAAPKKKSK
jgi:large subunit ribosomal protein L21